MTGQQKMIITTTLPMNVIYNFLHVHTLPEELEPSSPAQQACHPTNLATDPLQILIPSLLCTPAEGPAVHVTDTEKFRDFHKNTERTRKIPNVQEKYPT